MFTIILSLRVGMCPRVGICFDHLCRPTKLWRTVPALPWRIINSKLILMLFSRNDEQLQASELVSEMLRLKAGGTELRVPSLAVFNLRIAVVRFGLRRD